jgi:hypothetical protein
LAGFCGHRKIQLQASPQNRTIDLAIGAVLASARLFADRREKIRDLNPVTIALRMGL